MRGLWIAGALIACRSPAPRDPPRAPPEAPREVFSAYHVGGIRIEGAPPIDAAIRKVHDQQPRTQSARVFDFNGDLALIAKDGRCGHMSAAGTGRMDNLPCEGGWTRVVRGGVVYLRETEDERSELRWVGETLSPPGTVIDPLWDRLRERAFYGLASDQPAELWTSAPLKLTPDGAPRRIVGDGPWAPVDVAADGKFVLARRELATTESALYRIEIATGAMIALTMVGESTSTRGQFTRDGDLVAITDGERDRRGLELHTTWWRTRLADDVDVDVVEFAITDRGIVFVTEDAGVSTLRWIDPDTGHHQIVAGAPDGGVIRDLVGAKDQVAFTFTDATHARTAYIMQAGTSSTVLARWPGEKIDAPVPAIHELVADDGVRSQLLAYLPTAPNVPVKTRKAVAPTQVVIDFHGGPEDRALPKYDAFVHFLVGQGYAVIRPNVRGSAGQGRAFAALDDGDNREHVMRDVRAVLDWIATQPGLDAKNVSVMGTSYGGYLAIASLIAFPDRLQRGITLGAITDFAGFLAGTAAYRRDHRRAEYGDERDPATRAMLDRLSPITNVGLLKRPLLMAYGAKDPRVPPGTSEQFVRAARASGAQVWSMVASDEGHWFEHADNRRTFEILAAQFLGH